MARWTEEEDRLIAKAVANSRTVEETLDAYRREFPDSRRGDSAIEKRRQCQRVKRLTKEVLVEGTDECAKDRLAVHQADIDRLRLED